MVSHDKPSEAFHKSLATDGGERCEELFTALAATRRRYVLYYLQDVEQTTVTDTAQQIAAWEREMPAEDVPEEVIDGIETELYHNHLPRLQEARAIEYDERSKQLVYRDPPDLLEQCLNMSRPRELPD